MSTQPHETKTREAIYSQVHSLQTFALMANFVSQKEALLQGTMNKNRIPSDRNHSRHHPADVSNDTAFDDENALAAALFDRWNPDADKPSGTDEEEDKKPTETSEAAPEDKAVDEDQAEVEDEAEGRKTLKRLMSLSVHTSKTMAFTLRSKSVMRNLNFPSRT